MLLFTTNVIAILATGTIVMAIHGVWRLHGAGPVERASFNRHHALAVIVVMFVFVGVPLAVTSVRIARDTTEQAEGRDASQQWADSVGWELVAVDNQANEIVALFEGTPLPSTSDLPAILRRHGVNPEDVRVELVPRVTIELTGEG